MSPSAPAWLDSRAARALVAIAALGAMARVAACFMDGPLHPDEYFQYLEPAWWHLTGVGQETWEWMTGIRSWVLPFYNGAWLATLLALGMPRGPALVLSLKVHWALVNVSLIFVAYRGSAFVTRRLSANWRAAQLEPLTGFEGGLLGAFLVASFPLLVLFSAHTLSELPSMLCLLTGLVLTAELSEHTAREWSPALRNKAFCVGLLLSLGACLRIANAPMVLLAPAWLFFSGRFRALGWLLLGAVLPALVFALVDRFTWGEWAGSFVAYIKFNLIEGKAAQFGTEPPNYYPLQLWRRLPYALPLLVLPALWGLRATWPFVMSIIIALGYLSTQPHKEERFIVLVWPLLLIAAGGVVGALPARLRPLGAAGVSRWKHPRWFLAAVALLAFSVMLDGMLHAGGREWPIQARLDAQAWVGKQKGATGLLIDNPIDGGGALWFGSDALCITYAPWLLSNPLISHVILTAGSWSEVDVIHAGFERAQHFAHLVVLQRSAPKR